MQGSIWLGCGSANDERPLWLDMLGGRRTRIVYWPFALPPAMAATADDWLREGLDQLDVDYDLQTWHTLEDHEPAELSADAVDLLFVGGGNTFQLLDAVRSHGFIEPVRRFWSAGGDYYGGSAGAVLACDSIEIAVGHDANYPGLVDLSGLGLLSGVTVLPHFTDDQMEAAVRWVAEHGTAIVGLPESIGLHVPSAGGRARVIGAGTLSLISASGIAALPPGQSFEIPLS